MNPAAATTRRGLLGLRVRLLAAAIVLVAAALRLWRLEAVPPGFQFDEAYNAIDAAAVAAGQRALFFPANGGREPLLTYLHAPFLALLGRDHTVLAIRLVSAYVGVLTVALLFAVGAAIFGRRVGLLAAGFLAVSYWHLHFSRYAIRAILAPAWTALAVLAWWRATRGGGFSRSGRRPGGWSAGLAMAVCGAAMAGAVYSHPSGRLLPVLFAGDALALAVQAGRRSRAGGALAPAVLTRRRSSVGARGRDAWVALVGAGAVAAVLFAPLGAYFVRHPWAFTGHPADVSVVAVARERFGGNLLAALVDHAARILGMFFIAGDPSTFHNLPGLPVFDPATALLAILGAGVLLALAIRPAGRRGGAAGLVILWAAVMLLPTLLSDRPPNYSRGIAALPALTLVPALGAVWLAEQLATRAPTGLRRPRRWSTRAGPWTTLAARVAIPAALGVALVWTGWHYFVAFPRLDHVYYSYDAEKLDALAELRRRAAGADVYLSPLWAEHATIAYLNADDMIGRLDASSTLVIRHADRPAVVSFPAEEVDKARSARDFLGRSGTLEEVPDAKGNPLLEVITVSPGAWGDLRSPTDAPLEPRTWVGATYAGAIRLVGYKAQPPRPGQAWAVTLWWKSVAPVETNLTQFLHVTDATGGPVGQADAEPAAASFRTTQWRPGDVVIDRLEPTLDPQFDGPVYLTLGWYDATTTDRLPVSDGPDASMPDAVGHGGEGGPANVNGPGPGPVGATIVDGGTALRLGPFQTAP